MQMTVLSCRQTKAYDSAVRNRPAYSQNSVDNALLLVHILRDQGVVTVSQVAELLGVARSTSHRLLAMLVYRDFATETEDHRYVAGPALYVSAVEHRPTGAIRNALHSVMSEICSETGETVQLAVRTGRWIRFIATTESPHAVRVGDRRGVAMPARLTAVGKAMLSELSPPQLQQLYKASGADSESGIGKQEWQKLLRDLDTTRHNGFAVNQEETESGLIAVGVVLHDHESHAAVALSVGGPSHRLPNNRIHQLGNYLREKASVIIVPSITPGPGESL